ncbi:Ppx/GppA phosphatase [Halanaerobium saccharolyticum]|uniref:Ppx/GppA phosphatase n=1 Tax=Halanaerobium saccharolyticum TaxID=43595 RepID=A0A4R7YPF5_9FIRM|nr:Ppx/GppA phosphatase family protein [Halanaerobium saccharolyticum]RAK05121.1 Ppx/GppA phosphatase [Halanaerobium saccharolyticum]TDV98888.1 Ppx/GppA phosphatase [Halanaerobium saccharolyticum]TDX51590.1 Ppx/GppA phosphatase [Halanaerobium saccharolyticum]
MKAAAIDIGTNSCRLLIGEKASEQSFNILARRLVITRLGEGVDQNRKLKNEAVDRVFKALKKYKVIIEEYQVQKTRVIGTSALRDVGNSDLLKSKLKKLGFKLEIISGKREAELNYLGAVSNLEADFLLLDIGGGSTEFICPEDDQIKFKSLDLGCVRMTEKFVTNPEAKFGDEERNEIQKYVKNSLASELNLSQEFKVKGVGGTITTLAAVKLALEDYDSSKIENLKIKKSELEKIISDLSKVNLEERQKIKGLQPKRADIIIAGLIILKSILDYIDSKELYVSDHDLLYGLLKEELGA